MNDNIIVTEITASGDGHYMMAKVNGVEYKLRHEDPCTWENRNNAFQELLEMIPLNDRPAVEAEYDRYCEGLKNAEAEAEHLANMTDEERMELFMQQMAEMNVQQAVEDTEYEEVHEQTEA